MSEKSETKKPSGRSKHRGSALWFGLLFFVSVWMFVLGIIVGRGTAPVKFDIEKLQKELAELKEAVIKQELKRFKIKTDDGGKKPNLDFHEALKNPKEDVGLLPVVPEPKETQIVEKNSGNSQKRIKSKKRVNKATVQKNEPASKPKAVSSGKRLTIQVMSVKDERSADAVVEKLKKKGFPAYRTSGQIPGKGVYYRVRVGSFTNEDLAKETMNRLKRERYKPLLILQ